MTKFLTLILLIILFSCQSESRNGSSKTELITPKGQVIETTLAITPKEQQQGLSGVQPEDFEDDQGMLFYNLHEDEKHFWMPDTYFDLDLFYLDKDLRIIDIVRKLPHHKGRHNESLIPRARPVWCRHTLEMKASSPIAGSLQIGDKFEWRGPVPLSEMDQYAREKIR